MKRVNHTLKSMASKFPPSPRIPEGFWTHNSHFLRSRGRVYTDQRENLTIAGDGWGCPAIGELGNESVVGAPKRKDRAQCGLDPPEGGSMQAPSQSHKVTSANVRVVQ